ncbi:hypothetical protein PIB30_076931 [Stylosanthes scabra]|uniref:Uncharacterized protein n=1 Tax=Stylosanthes scabra TaxID=79078 RepID=A0ABU6QRI7_9FABA|nr:hypothetical protein [Stylosanthes scabra]
MDANSSSFDSESAIATDSIVQFFCDIDEEYIPTAGMTFPTIEEAGAFYKEYAKRTGVLLK